MHRHTSVLWKVHFIPRSYQKQTSLIQVIGPLRVRNDGFKIKSLLKRLTKFLILNPSTTVLLTNNFVSLINRFLLCSLFVLFSCFSNRHRLVRSEKMLDAEQEYDEVLPQRE